jgi:sortase A
MGVGLGLVGLCLYAYLDIWVHQGVQGFALWAAASNGEARWTRAPDYAPGQSMAWLEIPRLGISALVAHGDDPTTLHRAVGHIPGTALPGERGNVGLAGHRDTFLRTLDGIEIADAIRLVTPRESFSYRVVDVGIVEPSRVDVLDETPSPSLTLVTCYPFDYVGPAPYRYVVRAVQTHPARGLGWTTAFTR